MKWLAIFVLAVLFFNCVVAQALCGDNVVEVPEECDDGNANERDGCSSECKITLTEKVYIIPYVGDIDGEFAREWHKVYEKLAYFHDYEQIPASFSFYPSGLKAKKIFANAFLKMYESRYIELVQKGYSADELEQSFDKLPHQIQKNVVMKGQDAYIDFMSKVLNKQNIELPIVYNHISGRFNEDTRKVIEDLGFVMYLEMYIPDDLVSVSSSENVDVIQYGVSFTFDGETGRDTIFDSTGSIIKRIDDYSREDIEIMKIGDVRVVPLWVHHYDFEDAVVDNKFDEEKWKIYTETLIRLRDDPNAILVNGKDIYAMRHGISSEELKNIASSERVSLNVNGPNLLELDKGEIAVEKNEALIFTYAIAVFSFVLVLIILVKGVVGRR